MKNEARAQLALSSPPSRAVYQRDGEDRAGVPIRGTYAAGAETIEARAVHDGDIPVTTWQVIDNAPLGGTFSGNLMLPAGGWYAVEVRTLSGTTVTSTQRVERVGVGDVFITAGQSNAANHGMPRQTADDRVSALTSLTTGQWRVANDPQPIASGADGSPWPAFGNALVAQNGLPVGIVSLANGGTPLRSWLPGDTLYNRVRDTLRLLGPNGVRAVLWHQGESDALEDTSTTTYASRLNSIIAQSRIDAGWNVPWGVAIASYHDASSPAQQAAVVAGQHLVIDGDPLVFEGPNTDNFHSLGFLWDNVHFNGLGLKAHGELWAGAVTRYFASLPEPSSGGMIGVGSLLIPAILGRRRSK